MDYELDHRLVVGVAPSALFDLAESHKVFAEGIDAYRVYQDKHIDDALPKGAAFPFIERLLALNDLRPGNRLVEVIVLAKDDAITGLRVMKSIETYGLAIDRAVFTEGMSPYPYIPALNICLFLSGSRTDVEAATALGYPAGVVLGRSAPPPEIDHVPGALRVAFDFDGVLADDASERVYREHDLDYFLAYEKENAATPLAPGPLTTFLIALGRIQRAELERVETDETYVPRVRIALVTARQAPTHERAVRTLRAWDVQVNDAFFLGGVEKARVLRVLRPHIFFDDQASHLALLSQDVAGVLVPYGVANAPAAKQAVSDDTLPTDDTAPVDPHDQLIACDQASER